MVSRDSSSPVPVVVTLIDPSRVSTFHRLIAILLTFSLAIPPGVVFSQPIAQVPLDHFAANDATEGSAPDESSNEWKPGDAAPEHLTPPDGIPVQAPFPAEGTPKAETGIPLESGNCVITGEISDATSLNPIAGAFIDAVGTGRSVQSDGSGKFRIEGLPPGTYTLEATKLGYFTETTVITAIEAQPAEARFGLRIKPVDDINEIVTLEEETIVGEYTESSQGDLFLDLQAAPNIAAGISKEEFSKAAVSDAAGAVSKISGANIVGGKYAVVRGLGDRYSNTLVNGALISSADPSKKAVQLDLFPTDLLQSVAINKTFSPDLPAEFAGGIVLIETLRVPEERIINFEIKGATNSNLGDTFYENPDGDRDYWGDRDDAIPLGDLPDGFLSPGWTGRRAPGTRTENGVPPAQQLELAAESAAQMEAVHQSGGMTPKKRDPNDAQSFSVTLGDVYKLKNGVEVGGVFAFTRDQGDVVLDGVQVGRGINYGTDNKPGSDGSTGSADYVVRSQSEDRYTEFTNWGMLLGAGARFGENHEVGVTWFRNKSTEDEVTLGRNIREIGGEFPAYLPSDSNPFGAGAVTYQAFDSINPLDRELEFLQADGSHKFGEGDRQIRLDWMIARSTAMEDRPNSRTNYFSELDFTDPRIAASGDIYNPSLGVVYTSADPFGSSPPLVESFRESLTTNEDAGNESIDLIIPAWRESEENFLDLKVGYNHFNRDREVRGRLFTYTVSPTLNNGLLGDNGQYGVDYLDQIDSSTAPDGTPRFGGWTGPQANSQSKQLILTESTLLGRTVRNVDAGNEIDAYYLMGTAGIAGWGMLGGVRFETESRYYQILPNLNPTAFVNDQRVYTDNDYALPGLTLWRDFGDREKCKTPFSYSRTVTRPTFYEYAPVEIEDQATGDIIIGNPELTDTLITNYDLRFDWNITDRNRVSVNLFHKSMTDPIAQSYELEKKTWVNGEDGQLTGVELELSRDLGAGLSLTGNYTYIDSLLKYVQKINSSGESQIVDSSFEGQPENIFNLILGYDNEDLGLSASLVYNYTGSYLTGVPATVESPTIMRESYQSLDLVLTKDFQINNCDGSVTLKVMNLLDSEDTQVFAPTDLVYQSFSPGRSLSLSLDFEF